MPDPTIQSPLACPKCGVELSPVNPDDVACTGCKWRGQVYAFSPAALKVVEQAQAMPDDAACAHHPSKRAITTCAGSGDYICSLCVVEIDGQTYGAAYLETAGKAKATKAFDRYIPRPDKMVIGAVGISYLYLVPSLVAFPWGIVQFFKMQKLRREDPLYARIVSRRRAIGLGALLLIGGGLPFGLFIMLFLSLCGGTRRW